MGLRGKITGLFIVCIGLMCVLSAALLKDKLELGFVDIEHKQALEQMQQLTRNLNGELDRLSQQVSDWGNWDDVYNYARHPDKGFIERQITPSALKEIDLKLFALLDTQDKTLVSEAVNLINGQGESSAPFDPILDNIKTRIEHSKTPAEKACGIDLSTSGPILLCWKPIRKSDLSGEPVGTIVLGRLLNSALLSKIQTQSNIDFTLNPLPVHDEALAAPPKNAIEAEQIAFSESEPGVLNGFINNLLGQPILKIRLQLPGELAVRGEDLTWKAMRVVLIVTLAGGSILLGCVYWLVIRRIAKMDKDLSTIWRNGRWAGRLELPVRKDEINDLSHNINRMLALIRKQMVMLESIALTDPLTQIANRRAFDDRAAVELSLHKRNQTPLSILVIDIDYFKRYNDFYGHVAADDILKTIAQLLSHVACRPSDLPARTGGEEFAVILPFTDLDGACHVAELFTTKLAELRLAHEDSPISDYVTVCIGVTAAGNEDLDSLMQRADKSMYSAKQSGRNKICILPAADSPESR